MGTRNDERRTVSEEKAMEVAEASRQSEIRDPGFLKELFLGNFRLDLIHPFPEEPRAARFRRILRAAEGVPRARGGSRRDRCDGGIPRPGHRGPAGAGAFGMKIPDRVRRAGAEPARVQPGDEARSGRRCAQPRRAALAPTSRSACPSRSSCSAPRSRSGSTCPAAPGASISAFALTEPDVGSDPARMSTTAGPPTASDYLLNGEKLWCTNGTLADLLVVMARDPRPRTRGGITAFVVETDRRGHHGGAPRCRSWACAASRTA